MKKKSVIKKIGKNNLTIYFMTYSEIANKSSIERIKQIIGLILDNKIIILQGRLTPDQEARLIENSMTLIGNIKGFQGVEIATISGDSDTESIFYKLRKNIVKVLIGERDAITIIGPASIVKEIKRNPKKIELMLQQR